MEKIAGEFYIKATFALAYTLGKYHRYDEIRVMLSF